MAVLGGIAFGSPEAVFQRDPVLRLHPPVAEVPPELALRLARGVTVIVAVGHFLQGGIRPSGGRAPREGRPAGARAPVGAARPDPAREGVGLLPRRFDLLTSDRGVVQGASYTDVNAQLPALTFLTIVAVICAVLFFVNARYRVWSLPIIAVGLLLLVSILLGTAYPAFIQQFRVNPNEQQYEKTFIERNIAGTQTRVRARRDPSGGAADLQFPA